MNYLRITNKGLLETEDLTLIGSSTKRGDETKIGMFGSGWKYALAWIMRNHLDIKIYRGEELMKVDTAVVMHRDLAVSVITVDGVKTGFTTSMGPKWSGWMAVRELISNAIDEGEENIGTVFNPDTFEGTPDTTTIYLEMGADLTKVMRNYDSYFAFERKADFITRDGHLLYYKTESTALNVYRKGIKCFDTDRETLVDFNFRDISINESRLAGESTVDYKVRNIIDDESLPVELLVLLLNGKYQDILPKNRWNNTIHNHCIKLIEAGYTLTTGFVQAMRINPKDFSVLALDDDKILNISGKWYSQLVTLGDIESPFDMIKGNNVPEGAVFTDAEDIDAIHLQLKKFNIALKIKSGSWTSNTQVFLEGSTYYIKDGIFKDETLISPSIKYAGVLLASLGSSHFTEALQDN